MISLLILSIAVPINAFAIEEKDIPTMELAIAQKINEYRSSLELNQLAYDETIANVARAHSDDMRDRNYYAHETLGTNKQAWLRGSLAGYGICGDPDAVDRYYDTINEMELHKKRIAQFEKEAEEVRLFWNNDPLRVQIINQKYADLLNIEQKVNQKILKTHEDINSAKIGIGFNENLMELRGSADNVEEAVNVTIQSWLDSPPHKLGMEDYGNSIGIGVSIDEDRVLVTMNIC